MTAGAQTNPSPTADAGPTDGLTYANNTEAAIRRYDEQMIHDSEQAVSKGS